MTTTPPPDTPALTVEEALKELREMFPRHYCSISHEGRLVLGMSWVLKNVETVARIRVTSATIEDAMLPLEADADTLNEAMAQVRQWKASQP